MDCYILYRLVHSGETKSPYEIMYGVRPNIAHLRPFGSVCYVFVPPERRTKLANVREKARLIGFGDDDSAKEIRGYKVITEADLKIIWSNDVIFDPKNAFAALPSTNTTSQSEDMILWELESASTPDDEAYVDSSSKTSAPPLEREADHVGQPSVTHVTGNMRATLNKYQRPEADQITLGVCQEV